VKKRLFYMLFVPSLSMILFFLIYPLLLTTFPTFFEGNSLTLVRYLDFFMDDYFQRIFVRTLKISLMAAVVCAILGIPVAYFISKSSQKVRGLLIACTVFPLLTTLVGVMENIEPELMEAVESLGANRIKAFFKVILKSLEKLYLHRLIHIKCLIDRLLIFG